MRRLLFALCALAVAIPCSASHYGSQNMSLSVDDWSEVTSCNQVSVRFDDSRAVRAEEVLPTAGLRSLKIDSARNGGIHVVGTDATTYSVTACKAADVEETLRGQAEELKKITEIFTRQAEDRVRLANLEAEVSRLRERWS